MPKAKFKRKGAPPDRIAAADFLAKRSRTQSENATTTLNIGKSTTALSEINSTASPSCSILHLPEEVICLIVALLEYDVAALAALEASCRRLRQVIVDARLWRRLLVSKVKNVLAPKFFNL